MDVLKGGNPLGSEPVWRLIRKFAAPAVFGFLVNSIYNITDQIFIGHVVGMLGNAATNVAFPIVILVISAASLFGTGGATNLSLSLGKKEEDKAAVFAGNAISMMLISGIGIAAFILIFLEPLMKLFGATEATLSMSVTYSGITAVGIPFVLMTAAASHLIRADGSPNFAMFSTVIGAVINVVLDALFMFGFKWGIAGAAWATVIGQIVSGLITFAYIFRFKHIKLTKSSFIIKSRCLAQICRLGFSGFMFQIIMMSVQIVMNKSLNFYGSQSVYGADIPFAVVAVVSKLSGVIFAFLVGIALGCQPIFGFNYGAKNYKRVKETYYKALLVSTAVSVVSFLLLQFFPRQIASLFGGGSEEYFRFAERYMRIFMLMMFMNSVHPLTSNFFTATGKARQGIFLTISRQGLFLIPLLLILPRFIGIDGILYAGPISDAFSAAVSISLAVIEMRKLSALDKKSENDSF